MSSPGGGGDNWMGIWSIDGFDVGLTWVECKGEVGYVS